MRACKCMCGFNLVGKATPAGTHQLLRNPHFCIPAMNANRTPDWLRWVAQQALKTMRACTRRYVFR